MANSTVVQQAGNQAANNPGIIQVVMDQAFVFAAVGFLGTAFAAAVYIYFSDKQYNYLTRASAWISSKISADEEKRGKSEEDMEKLAEKAVENKVTEVNDKKELFNAIESFGEEKEHAGRQEERKKQRKDENLKDLLTIVLLTSGINLLLRLFEMFA